MNGGPKPVRTKTVFDKDEGPRADTSLEALAKLKPVFHAHGHGDGRQFVADQRWRGGGARDVGQKARELGLKPHGAIRELRRGGSAAGDHGHRSGGGDSESA